MKNYSVFPVSRSKVNARDSVNQSAIEDITSAVYDMKGSSKYEEIIK